MTTNSINLVDFYFIYSVTTLFNVGHTIVTRLIKTNLTKTDIIDKNFKTFDMQHKNSESFVGIIIINYHNIRIIIIMLELL